jgi:peptide/nickel transport system substrate-binding protein
MRALALLGPIAAIALLGGCRQQADNRTIEASVIGTTLAPPQDKGLSRPYPAAVAGDATTSGLVRLDRDGQVIAGAAVRWAILDDGLDYIFRIDDAAGVAAPAIARRLRAAIRPRRGDPARAVTSAIESIEAVTGTVIEMRLSAPQPDLLTLLAGPDYAVGARGPMLAQARGPAVVLLRPEAGADPRPMPVLLRAEPAGRAVARFVAGRSDLVLGGRFTDLPVARAAGTKRGALRFDPATGLLGFVLRDASGPAAAADVRQALALAIDRDRIVAAIGADDLAKATTLAGSAIEPPLADRRAEAARLVAGRPLAIRVAMPAGPGARRLFRLVVQDWASIGIAATAVGADGAADLALVDLVTPPGSRAAFACALSAGCDPRDRLALIDPPYIPIAAPVRWSLVAKRIDLFDPNGLAAHPLDRLRAP